MRTITVELDDIRITLSRPSLADGAVRRSLFDALSDRTEDGKGLFCYYITQLVEAVGINHQKLTVFPGKEAANQMFDEWYHSIPEDLANKAASAVNTLRGQDTGEKKASEPPSEAS